MTCQDWRSAPAGVIKPLYDFEIDRWATTLHWDMHATWQQVEAARLAGSLPGFVVEDNGGVAGWTFHLLHRGSLQIGTVVSSSQAVTQELLDHALASDEASVASTVLVFAHASAPGLIPALERRGFAVERYRYLERSLSDRSEEAGVGRVWDARDVRRVADLMSRAYEGGDVARPFAREGDSASWLEYVRQLTTTAGCGVFMPNLSVIVSSSERTSLAAAVLATVVGPGTGHLAQVAVDPDARSAGLGRRAVVAAMSNLRAAGFERVTLLVGEGNSVAQRLYRDLGFLDTAEFVSAVVDQPRRFKSAALATGGASTFR